MAAARDGLDELLAELPDDTRNVLLTLARAVVTVRTGDVVPEDVAVDRVLPLGPAEVAAPLALARDGYRGDQRDDWSGRLREARHAAAALVDLVGLA